MAKGDLFIHASESQAICYSIVFLLLYLESESVVTPVHREALFSPLAFDSLSIREQISQP